jgi:catechol 2,3-dioxygenase-like lactoylglutathione lyase family enzyme
LKTHLNLRTGDLDKSVAFYETLLNTQARKHYKDYALLITESPGLELALDLDPRLASTESAHYGVVVDTTAEVDAAIVRLQAAGLPVHVEREEQCCYALQTKVWASDPDGRRWEVYTVLEEAEERNGDKVTCC